jgi:uncharacterized Ntn-hydrolase superfamily protein
VTFSIVARSRDSQLFGLAIASSSPAVAARCAHARAGVGAVASQNITDPALGPLVLDALASGAESAVAIERVLAGTPHAQYRQLLAVGASGPPAVHSGSRALGIVASAISRDSAAAGNLLRSPEVPAAMSDAFERAHGDFAPRLLAAMRAGLAAGGEAGPIHSAGLLIVRDQRWPIVDLRVDWAHAEPLGALGALWELYAPQLEAYVQRAVDPGAAPSFGVPGNL